MWVPFELGAAYQANKGIGTFIFGWPPIPDYLKPFAQRKKGSELDEFIQMYKSTKSITLREDWERKIATASSKAFAQKFAEVLKRKVGR